MKVKTNKSDLIGALVASSRAIQGKSPVPIMDNFLLQVKDEEMTVTATDGSMTIVASLPAKGDGSSCVDAKRLLEAVRLLPDTDIEITAENGICTVDYGQGKFSIPTFPVEDYPDVSVKFTPTISVQSDTLRAALSYVMPSVAKDPMRPQLNGVYFNAVEGGFDIVASDSHTLSVQTVPCETASGAFIIPTNAALFLRDNIGDGEVLLADDGNKAVFGFGNISISVVKVVGKFPNYQVVLPKNNESQLTATLSDLLAGVKRVSLCANKQSNAIKFELSTLAGATVEAQDIGFGCSAREEMGFVTYNGEDLTIGFKCDLLANLLGAVSEEVVTMSFSNSRGAVLITTDNESRKALIMPVAVS